MLIVSAPASAAARPQAYQYLVNGSCNINLDRDGTFVLWGCSGHGRHCGNSLRRALVSRASITRWGGRGMSPGEHHPDWPDRKAMRAAFHHLMAGQPEPDVERALGLVKGRYARYRQGGEGCRGMGLRR